VSKVPTQIPDQAPGVGVSMGLLGGRYPGTPMGRYPSPPVSQCHGILDFQKNTWRNGCVWKGQGTDKPRVPKGPMADAMPASMPTSRSTLEGDVL
jgi:hypothetical protein